jgi:hypothetical protein
MKQKKAKKEEYVYVLRTCKSDITAYNGFKWPESGMVEAPDWQNNAECGNGLHGLLWGIGDGSFLNWDEGAKWLVVKVAFSSIIDLGGKVKFPRGEVIFCGDKLGATTRIIELGANPALCVNGTATAGVRGTATAGYAGTATAGDDGTATAGVRGTATAGYAGTVTAGDDGIITIKWFDDKNNRYRFSVGYIGEDGLKKNVKYKCDENGKFIEVEK